MDLMIEDFLSHFFIISAVLKCIAIDVVNMKGILLMYMMSTAGFTSLYVSKIN